MDDFDVVGAILTLIVVGVIALVGVYGISVLVDFIGIGGENPYLQHISSVFKLAALLVGATTVVLGGLWLLVRGSGRRGW